MIDELVKLKYESDPVKTWKTNIDKEAALVSLTKKGLFFFSPCFT